ncbi:MAG: hypothetical protein ACOC1U_04385 [Spirochaetota bacterium]
MSPLATVLITSFYLVFPALVLYAGSKNRFLRGVNPVIVSYLVGIGLGNIGVLRANVAGLQDTMIITSTAAVCSPPIVGMVGIAVRNRAIISAGIVVGIIGYAVGNYLGIFIALVVERLA